MMWKDVVISSASNIWHETQHLYVQDGCWWNPHGRKPGPKQIQGQDQM